MRFPGELALPVVPGLSGSLYAALAKLSNAFVSHGRLGSALASLDPEAGPAVAKSSSVGRRELAQAKSACSCSSERRSGRNSRDLEPVVLPIEKRLPLRCNPMCGAAGDELSSRLLVDICWRQVGGGSVFIPTGSTFSWDSSLAPCDVRNFTCCVVPAGIAPRSCRRYCSMGAPLYFPCSAARSSMHLESKLLRPLPLRFGITRRRRSSSVSLRWTSVLFLDSFTIFSSLASTSGSSEPSISLSKQDPQLAKLSLAMELLRLSPPCRAKYSASGCRVLSTSLVSSGGKECSQKCGPHA
mmetsp:Transcript_31007/g.79610  ORF Transcript_31007/g.79610 Transcript_31007/m.79610 type:complete len:298 (+) Transcript_31007:179-1072(+)